MIVTLAFPTGLLSACWLWPGSHGIVKVGALFADQFAPTFETPCVDACERARNFLRLSVVAWVRSEMSYSLSQRGFAGSSIGAGCLVGSCRANRMWRLHATGALANELIAAAIFLS